MIGQAITDSGIQFPGGFGNLGRKTEDFQSESSRQGQTGKKIIEEKLRRCTQA